MKANTVTRVKKVRKEAAAIIKNGYTKKDIKLFWQMLTLKMVGIIDSFILIAWLIYDYDKIWKNIPANFQIKEYE